MARNNCRNEELNRLRQRYGGRGREGKRRLLDEFCEHYGYERKHAIKLLGNGLPAGPGGGRAGPEPVYEPIRGSGGGDLASQ